MTDPSHDKPADASENNAGAPGQEELEDWDKTRDGGEMQSFGRSGERSLAQLMKLHAEEGKDISLTEDEEKIIEAELGKWVNDNPNPYEAPESSKETA